MDDCSFYIFSPVICISKLFVSTECGCLTFLQNIFQAINQAAERFNFHFSSVRSSCFVFKCFFLDEETKAKDNERWMAPPTRNQKRGRHTVGEFHDHPLEVVLVISF